MTRPRPDETASEASPPPLTQLLLTKDQAAAALCISARQVERLVARQELTPTRIGGAIRFSPAALAAFVETHTESAVQWPSRRVAWPERRARLRRAA